MARSDESRLRWPTLTSRHLRRLENCWFRGRSKSQRFVVNVLTCAYGTLLMFGAHSAHARITIKQRSYLIQDGELKFNRLCYSVASYLQKSASTVRYFQRQQPNLLRATLPTLGNASCLALLDMVCDKYKFELPTSHSSELRQRKLGVCWDNAAAESFFATLKNEMYYNRKGLHSTLGYQTPSDVLAHYHAASFAA